MSGTGRLIYDLRRVKPRLAPRFEQTDETEGKKLWGDEGIVSRGRILGGYNLFCCVWLVGDLEKKGLPGWSRGREVGLLAHMELGWPALGNFQPGLSTKYLRVDTYPLSNRQQRGSRRESSRKKKLGTARSEENRGKQCDRE